MKSSYSIEHSVHSHDPQNNCQKCGQRISVKKLSKRKKKKKERRQAIKRDKSGGKQIKSRVIIVDIVSAMRS